LCFFLQCGKESSEMRPTLLLLPVILVLSMAPLQALGPGPFRNGSPLASGTDGVYQAVATAPNVTGLFSWSITQGTQTSGQRNNNWVFFVDGELITGNTVASMSQGKVSGVLDSGLSSGLPTNPDGTVPVPLAFVIPGNAASGFFNGQINLKSPVAAFKGDGLIQGLPERTDLLVYILDLSNFVNFGANPPEPVIDIPLTTGPANLDPTTFQFRGTRVSNVVVNQPTLQSPASN